MDVSKLSQVLDSRLETFKQRLQCNMELRMQGPIVPNGNLTLLGTRGARSEKDILLLTVISWKLGFVGYLLRDVIERKIGNNDSFAIKLCLKNETAAMTYFSEHQSERDFFGNSLPRILQLAEKLQFAVVPPRKPRKMVRRRGYNDHGTLVPSYKWKPKSDWSLDGLQKAIERNRAANEATLDFLEGFFT